MNCKSHFHLGKIKNFLLRTFFFKFKISAYFPLGYKQNCNGEICLDRQLTNAGRAWYNYWSQQYYVFRVIYTQILKQSVLKANMNSDIRL